MRTVGTSQAQKLIQDEAFKRSLERANAKLAIAVMGLNVPNVYIDQLSEFVSSAHQLADVCELANSSHSPLEVLFWLRERLQKEAKDDRRGRIYMAQAGRYIELVEDRIRVTCEQLGDGKVVALL